jgi:lysophospholipase L1-like esterase
MKHFLFCAILSALTWQPAIAALGSPDPDPWPGVKRVVFLGDSITYAGVYVNYVETWLVTRLTERRIEVLNLGLPSETVSGLSEDGHAGGSFPRPDLHERLDRVLAATRPDLVVACYGMNCGIYLPFDESRFSKYREGIQWLRERCQAAGARVIHLTPPVYDDVKGGKTGYRDTLRRYSDWLIHQREKGWEVVDIQTPMSRALDAGRARDPGFALAKDGVHPGEKGHWIMAREVLRCAGAKDVDEQTEAAAMLRATSHGEEVFRLVSDKQAVLKDAWLTETRHLRPQMSKGLPLVEAQARAAELDRRIRDLTRSGEAGR